VRFKNETNALTDTGYLGMQKLHGNTSMPKKKSKKHPLTQQERLNNTGLTHQSAESPLKT
jgi:hypothetical protein